MYKNKLISIFLHFCAQLTQLEKYSHFPLSETTKMFHQHFAYSQQLKKKSTFIIIIPQLYQPCLLQDKCVNYKFVKTTL